MSRRGDRATVSVAACGAAVLTGIGLTGLRRLPEPLRATWDRTNHAGRPVSLLQGVAVVLGTTASAVLTRGRGPQTPAAGDALALVVLAAGTAGAVDDLRPGADRKGLRGHLGALLRARPTSGAVKIVVIGAASLVAVAAVDSAVGRGATPEPARPALVRQVLRPHTLAGAGVVAGAANLANLLDLRPGRALKAVLLTSAPIIVSTLRRAAPAGGAGVSAAVAAGAALAALPGDLRARGMLGDTGANPLGAAVGLAVVQATGLPGRCVALLLLTGLILASERVSFTEVIERVPVLRVLDEWGREGR